MGNKKVKRLIILRKKLKSIAVKNASPTKAGTSCSALLTRYVSRHPNDVITGRAARVHRFETTAGREMHIGTQINGDKYRPLAFFAKQLGVSRGAARRHAPIDELDVVALHEGTRLRVVDAETGAKRQIAGGFAAVTTGFDVEGNLLVVFQTGQTGALDCRDVNKHIFGAMLGLNEAETFVCQPLDLTFSHDDPCRNHDRHVFDHHYCRYGDLQS